MSPSRSCHGPLLLFYYPANMEKVSCNLPAYEKEPNLFITCGWNEGKDWIEEGLAAISSIRGKVAIISHGICQNHSNEMKAQWTDPLQKWDEAKKRIAEENAKKIIIFP